MLMLLSLAAVCFSYAGEAAAAPLLVNAFYVRSLPETYAEQEKMFSAFRNTGINTVIIELPLTSDGHPDREVVPNIVFLAHHAGIKLQVVLPTRSIPGPIAAHGEWEDLAYDLNKDGYKNTGKLDLFNTKAVSYLTDLAKEIASYSIDGLLLGADFSYEPLEGMSRAASSFASSKLNATIEPANLYLTLGKGPEGRFIQEYSTLFHRWTVVKRDRLLTVFELIRSSVRKSNTSAAIGITIPVVYPLASQADMLTRFAIDVEEYRKRNADYFLAPTDYRYLQEQKQLDYMQAIEEVSRISRSAFSMVKDGRRIIVVLPMTERLTGKPLRSTEIEEVYNIVRSAGNIGVGLMIKSDTELNGKFTTKLLKN